MYWRRRLVAIAAVVAAIVLFAWACTMGGGNERKPNAQGPGAHASASPSPGASSPPPITPGPTPPGPAVNNPAGQPPASAPITTTPAVKGVAGVSGGVGSLPGCTAESARLSVTPDRETYPAGVRPRFRITVLNTGPAACAIDLGQGYVALLVTAGADRVWSSTDCPSDGAAPVAVAPRQARTEVVTWQRVRSRPGCVPNQPAAGPGRYAVEAAVGNLGSGKTYFTLS